MITVFPSQVVRRITVPAVFCHSALQGFKPPYIVISETSTEPMLTLAEPVFGMRSLEVDIECYGYSEPEARAGSKVVREIFDDYTGAAGDNTILAVIWQDEGYIAINPREGRDTRYHVVTTNYTVQYE